MKTSIKNKLALLTPEWLVTIIVTLIAVVAVPAAVFAWGPARATFTQANPASYVTFDSITDNPKWGDERNFFRVRDIASGQTYGDDATLSAGKKYEAIILYHNNAATNLNASGQGIAHNAYARAEMPAIVKGGSTGVEAEAFVGASNANPTSVFDQISFNNPGQADIALRYIPGTEKLTNNGAANGTSLDGTSIFSQSGQPLGFDTLDGTLPGCDHYSGFITFQFEADQPNFTFAKDVRMNGTKDWANTITANQGQTVDYRLSYDNTGTTEQDNVVLKDVLPKGLTYVSGSAKIQNSTYPDGTALKDGINGDGANIGTYDSGSNAYLVFSAKIDSGICGPLKNTAAAETNNGNEQATATVTVQGANCSPAPAALPQTGPAEVVAALSGVGAISLGAAYSDQSRRDLELALHSTESQTMAIRTITKHLHRK